MIETSIRNVRLSDAGQIADIYNYYVTETTVSFEVEPLSVDQMAQRIEAISRDFPYIVCCDGDRVVGYAYAHAWKERPAYSQTWETTVYLRHDCVGRGIGRRLMERLIEQCRSLPVHSLIACITGENTSSIEFHLKLGFDLVSNFTQVGFKFNRWLDVVDLQYLFPDLGTIRCK